MTREQMKRFLELVDSGAPLKSYRRELGLDVNAYQYHLTRHHYYRELLEEEKRARLEPASVVAPLVVDEEQPNDAEDEEAETQEDSDEEFEEEGLDEETEEGEEEDFDA